MRDVLVLFGCALAVMLAGCQQCAREGGGCGSVPPVSTPGSVAPPPPVPAISVAPSAASITVRTPLAFTATLQNMPSSVTSQDIQWSLDGPDCSTFTCGSLSASSGAAVTYTAPVLPPNPNSNVRITASAGGTSGSVTFAVANNASSNGELSGDYAFQFFGFDVSAQSFPGVHLTPGAIGMAGRFHADGMGGLSHVATDASYTTGTEHSADQIGVYSLGSDHRGTLVLNTGRSSVQFHFAMNSSGNGRLIEFDSTQGAGRLGTGEFRKQDHAALSLAAFNGDFAFGFSGEIPGDPPGNGRLAMAGRFTSDANGDLTRGHETANRFGSSSISHTALSSIDSATGRGTTTWAIPNFAISNALTASFAFYVVDAEHAFFITTSERAPSAPNDAGKAFLVGEAREQHLLAGGPYLSGPAIYYTSGTAFHGVNPTVSYVTVPTVGKLSFTSTSALSGTIDSGQLDRVDGTWSPQAATGTFAVTPSLLDAGRVSLTMSGGGSLTTIYLSGPNEGFVLGGTGESGAAGFLEPQVSLASGIEGDYVGATLMPALTSAPNALLTLRLANGLATGIADVSTPAGLAPDGDFSGSYSPGLAAEGRYDFILSSPLHGDFVGWHIKPGKLLLLPVLNNGSNIDPVIYVAER